MIFDTNLIIQHIRKGQYLPSTAVIPVVVVGELRSFAFKADWGIQKTAFLENLFKHYPIVEVTVYLTENYALIDAYSQGKLQFQPLPPNLSSRNMGKNDIWIAATALYLDMELHTKDNDFDHLVNIGLKLVK